MWKAYNGSLPLGLPLGLPLERWGMPLGAWVCHWAAGHGVEAPGRPKKPHAPRRGGPCATTGAQNAPESASTRQRTPDSRQLRPESPRELQRGCRWRTAAAVAYSVPQWHTQCPSGILSGIPQWQTKRAATFQLEINCESVFAMPQWQTSSSKPRFKEYY